MNYTDWCELLLGTIGSAGDQSGEIRNYGIAQESLAQRVWGDHSVQLAELLKTHEGSDIIFDAVFDLHQALLVEDSNATFIKLTREGRNAAKEIFPVWESACLIKIDSVMENALKIINRLTHLPDQYFGRVELIPMNTVHCELDDEKLTQEDVWEVLRELKARGLVYWDGGDEPEEIRATYRGLLWETRRNQVLGVRFIDGLLDEGETTSVEFKRELQLDTPNQRAAFIKVLIGLANTQASGRRWLIVGFDDKTRGYHGPPPDLAVTRNRIETTLARYVAPSLDVRYEVIDYKGGPVGKLEVMRDPKKLPYTVSKSLGDKRGKTRIDEGQIFVRHGSQTEAPSDAELHSIYEEADRAKSTWD